MYTNINSTHFCSFDVISHIFFFKGKTIVTLTFLGMLMRAGLIRNALVVAPVMAASNWEEEANKWIRRIVPRGRVHLVTSDTERRQRREILRAAHSSSLSNRYVQRRQCTGEYQLENGMYGR